MAIGSEQLVRGDAVAATAAFNAAKKLGEPAADTALVVAGYNAKSPDAAVSRLELLAPTSPFARYELGVVQLWAGRLPQATAALRAVRDAAPPSRSTASRPTTCCTRPCSPATRCSCRPRTRRRARRSSR